MAWEILSLRARWLHTAQGCYLCSCYWRITQFTSLDTCRASARGGKICHVCVRMDVLCVLSKTRSACNNNSAARAVVALNRQPGRQTCPAKCLVRIMQHKTHTLSRSAVRSPYFVSCVKRQRFVDLRTHLYHTRNTLCAGKNVYPLCYLRFFHWITYQAKSLHRGSAIFVDLQGDLLNFEPLFSFLMRVLHIGIGLSHNKKTWNKNNRLYWIRSDY